ncbi:MAG: HAMP domain-containing sensor histidine kinase [Ghiorsea sp.]
MTKSLHTKLALSLALVLGLVGMVYVLLMTTTVRDNTLYAEQILNRDLAKALVAERNLVRENELDKDALKSMFMAYMSVNPSIEIYLLDLHGKILSYSADPEQVKRKSVEMNPIHQFLQEDAMFPVLGDDPRDIDRQKVFSVTAIPMTEHPSGYLYVILRGEQYDQVEQLAHEKELLHWGLWVVGIALFVGLVAGLLVFYPIARRLQKLSKDVDTFRKNDFKTQPTFSATTSEDELGQLESNIALMAKQMVNQLQYQEKQELQRRDLFASLSHDLRTPLATMHGYLETLLIKANDLDETQRQNYTERAMKFSNRLKALVDELFEMATLDTLDTAPHLEAFALPELVQDIVQQFEDKAQGQGVSLSMSGDIEINFVYADIALIQRVFENLIGNALRHVQSGDAITINLKARDKVVSIEVEDTGSGIAEEHLEQIFEPLYQVNNAHRGGSHAGLGLAIVQRIITLHGSQITVESTINKGTKFIFTLPMDG